MLRKRAPPVGRAASGKATRMICALVTIGASPLLAAELGGMRHFGRMRPDARYARLRFTDHPLH